MPTCFTTLKQFTLLAVTTTTLLLASLVSGSPIELISIKRRNSLSVLTAAEISAFKPYTYFASTAYCKPTTTSTWSCGATCNANPTFVPVNSGGDGSSIQFWYVGYDKKLKTVVVAHQGTDPSKIKALVTDIKIFWRPLGKSLFPGVSTSVKVHSGFAEQHAKTADAVMSSVKLALSKSGFNKVTLVGHSLGAALALLDGVYLFVNLKGVEYRVIGYGMPRVGNHEFADYVDLHIDVTRINNRLDPIPSLPGRFAGYRHPKGERHIVEKKKWIACLGQDNPSSKCTIGSVLSHGIIMLEKLKDHSGPYDGISMGCQPA